jgi:hypothetical protein
MTEKRCSKCGVVQPLENFYMEKTAKDGYRNDCKACFAERARERYLLKADEIKARVKKWQEENPERHAENQARWRDSGGKARSNRKSYLKRTFNLTLEDYDQMVAAQDGGCAICGDAPDEGKTFHIDHEHETGEVRGLLCQRCNHALGLFRESNDLLYAAAEYLSTAERESARELVLARLRVVAG